MYDKNDRIIYAGNIHDQVMMYKNFKKDFTKAVKGSYPINGDRYLKDEFTNIVGEEAIQRLNSGYLGCQEIFSDKNGDSWWVYYVPVGDILAFNRIDPATNSNGVVKLILEGKGWESIYNGYERYPNNELMELRVWSINGSQKLIISRTCYNADDHVNRVIREASIEAVLPSKYNPGFTSLYSRNLFFEERDRVTGKSYCDTWKNTIGLDLYTQPKEVGKYVYEHMNGKYIGSEL